MEYELNQMNRIHFAILHLCWSAATHLFFMARMFRRLRLPGAGEPLSPEVSRRLFLAVVALCTAAGFLSALKHGRNRWCVALNVLTPYGIYLALAAAAQTPLCLWISAMIFAGAMLSYAAVLFSAPIHHRKNRALVLEIRFYQLVSAVWLLARVMLCLLASAAIAGTALGFFVIRPAAKEYSAVTEEPGAVDQWEQQLQGLRKDRWDKLALQERVELMQLVADIETGYLGLPEPLRVNCQTMPPNTMAAYLHDLSLVYVNRDHLLYDPPAECLNSVLHEAYHSAQHHLCALYGDVDDAYRSLVFLRPAREYMAEFEHYNSGELDYGAYYDQTCETDARGYARDRSAVYQRLLSEWDSQPDSPASYLR